MPKARIGRVLVASLHQAIVEELPTRLEFYEYWLNGDGLRNGTIGLAPVQAVLSFLRQEEAGYRRVVLRAGELATEWRLGQTSRVRRACIRRLPQTLRARAVLGVARKFAREDYSESVGRVSLRRGHGRLTIVRSVFCEVSSPVAEPLCAFYAAAVASLLTRFGIPSQVELIECLATRGDACTVGVTVGTPHASPDTEMET